MPRASPTRPWTSPKCRRRWSTSPQELGYSQAPVVVNNTDDQDHWSGLRRDKIVQAAMNRTRALSNAAS